MRGNKLLFGILLLALFLRGIFLDRVPVAISGDEMIYSFIAKFILLTGSDISGTWNPLSIFLFQYPLGAFPQAELPYFLSFFSFGSLFLSKLPHVIFSVGIIYALYLLTKQLFTEKTALWVAFLACINPWLIVIGRTGYEMNLAMFFYILGFYLLLKAKSTLQLVITFAVFLLGFYSYIGTKLIFLPVILLGVGYVYWENKKEVGKKHVLFVGASILVVGLYGAILLSTSTSRVGEIFLPTHESVSKTVGVQRQNSVPSPLSLVMGNKLVVYTDILLKKTAAVLSPEYLFMNGDQFYGIQSYGLFHVVDGIGILVGMWFLFSRYPKKGWVLVGLILLSIVPQLFHKNPDNFSPHNTLLIPFLLIVAGVGISEFQTLLKGKQQKLFSLSLLLLYTFFIAKFSYVYFTRYPLLGGSDLPLRVMAAYVQKAQEQNKKIVVFSNNAEDVYKKYLFYSNKLNNETVVEIRQSFEEKKYTLGEVTIMSCDLNFTPDTTTIYIAQSECGSPQTTQDSMVISRLVDGGAVYRIYNDPFCNYDLLQGYISTKSFSQLNVEALSLEEMCTQYMTK